MSIKSTQPISPHLDVNKAMTNKGWLFVGSIFKGATFMAQLNNYRLMGLTYHGGYQWTVRSHGIILTIETELLLSIKQVKSLLDQEQKRKQPQNK